MAKIVLFIANPPCSKLNFCLESRVNCLHWMTYLARLKKKKDRWLQPHMITYATFIYKTVTFDKVMIYLIGLMTVWKLQVLYIFIISHIFLFLLLPHKFLIISSRKHASTNEQIKLIKNKINMISEFFCLICVGYKDLKTFLSSFLLNAFTVSDNVC